MFLLSQVFIYLFIFFVVFIKLFLIEANHRLQSSIDKFLIMFEETSKQLIESNSLQIQLADKLEENQNELNEARVKLLENEEKLNELVEKLAHCEGNLIELYILAKKIQTYPYKDLVETYKNDMNKKQQDIATLEEKLASLSKELISPRDETNYVAEKSEASSLECARKDLGTTRDAYANEMNDSEYKGKKSFFKYLFKPLI